MPPVSGRRRARKSSDVPKPEADINDSIQTPTRKRRKINGADIASASINANNSASKPIDTHDKDDGADNRSDVDAETAPYSLADDVIRHLHVANYRAAVVKQYNNSVVDPSAQAFAKIAGRDWTFYVSKLRVTIGRPNNKKISADADTERWDMPQVDIDLGPDQQISRLHAEISFDHQAEKWFILINGRNGSYVDTQRLERGQKTYLHSGNVINILGTQMMFLLPGTPPDIHASIEAQLIAEEESDAGTQEEQPQQSQSSAMRNRGKTTNASQSTHPIQSNYRSAAGSNTKPSIETPIKVSDMLQPKSKTSPTYGRGVMMESTEEIDYSLDSAKDIKPPHSYAAMIGQAILSTPEEKATLARIYEYIKEKYAFFRHAGAGWQNSIRHNLSLSKHFEKVPRRTDEPGKGMKWQLVAEGREDYMRKNMQPTRRARNVGSSAPNSPAIAIGAAAQTERLMGIIGEPSSGAAKKHTRSITPPVAAYPSATESFTPDRGPQASFLTSGPLPPIRSIDTPPTDSNAVTPSFSRSGAGQESEGTSGAPEHRNQILRNGRYHSPPTLAHTTYDGPPGTHLFTPLPPKTNPLAALQSTAKVPSFYAKDLFSSPAPFWKFANIGSTPARLPDLSPVKIAKEEEDDSPVLKTWPAEEERKSDILKQELVLKEEKPQTHPSSPPDGANNEYASPTRTLSRPLSRSNPNTATDQAPARSVVKQANGVENGPNNVETFTAASASHNDNQQAKNKSSIPESSAYAQPLPAMMSMNAANPLPRASYSRIEAEDDDDGDIDLTRGFEKIGSYHQTFQTNVASR